MESPTNCKLGTQTEYEYPYRPRSAITTKVKGKVAMSLGASNRCWPISREWKVPETAKLVGRLPVPRKIMSTSFKVKRWKIKVDYCWDRKCIISTEQEGLRTLKLVRRWSMHYQLPQPAMLCMLTSEIGFLHFFASGGHTACLNSISAAVVLYRHHCGSFQSSLKPQLTLGKPFYFSNAVRTCGAEIK